MVILRSCYDIHVFLPNAVSHKYAQPIYRPQVAGEGQQCALQVHASSSSEQRPAVLHKPLLRQVFQVPPGQPKSCTGAKEVCTCPAITG